MIPQANPGATIAERRPEYDAAIMRVLDSGQFILGDAVAEFEHTFAGYVGVTHCVGVASGTDAVELALRAVGVGPGDAVFTVSHTAVATVAAIIRIGALPVLVDIDEATYTMAPDDLRRAVRALPAGTEAKAVLPVHLYGGMADMPAIVEVAREAGLQIVEDCAQAHGAALSGRAAGTFGDAAAFSFYPTKNLGGVGDGGAVVTNRPDVASAVRELREYGWRTRFVSERDGVNSRLDEVQAAVLSVGLMHLEEDNARRGAIADRYDQGLRRTDFTLPRRRPRARHVFHQYVIRAPRRDAFRSWCSNHEVGTAIHYPVPVHRQPAFRDRLATSGRLRVTEQIADEIVSLPMFPQLSGDDVSRVIGTATAWRPSIP